MTYATRTSYSSPSPPFPHKNSQDGASSTLARAPTQCTRGNRWLMASPGSRSFFHKPRVNPPPPPNLATLLHCTQISAINFPPLCRGASLATHRPSFDHPILSLPLSRSFIPRLFPPHVPVASVFNRVFLSPNLPRPTPLYGCTVRIVIGKQISMVVLKVSALMEPSIRSTKILVPSVSLSLSPPSLSFVSYV